MIVHLSNPRTRRTRRSLSVLSIIALSVALAMVDATDGRLAWSLLGNSGSIVVLALHWRLTSRRSTAARRREKARLQLVPTRSFERLAG